MFVFFSLKVFVVENICVSTLFVTGDADDHQAEQDGGGGHGGEGDGNDGGINAGDGVYSDGAAANIIRAKFEDQ